VVGRKEGIDIYELHAEKDDIAKPMQKAFADYELGLKYYFEQNWEKALKYFTGVLGYIPNDPPSQVMRDRCLLYQVQPPAPDWGGIYTLSSK
jgi:adenylate cyclase